MPKRNRHKKVPVLSAEEAIRTLQLSETYQDILDTVMFCIKEDAFLVKYTRDAKFAKRLDDEFQQVFDQVYQEELPQIMIPQYREKYLTIPQHHFENTFNLAVLVYMNHRLCWIFSDGPPKDGFGAIY